MLRMMAKQDNRALSSIGADELDAANGGVKWRGREPSKNVIDCRGTFCRDHTGSISLGDTLAHKLGIGGGGSPMPKGDGGPLSLPKAPEGGGGGQPGRLPPLM